MHAGAGETLAPEQKHVRQPFSFSQRRESGSRSGVGGKKRVAHVGTDFESRRPDRRAEKCEQVVRLGAHRRNRVLDHARAQAAPAGMCDRHDARLRIAQQYRHAVGDHDRAHRFSAARVSSVGLGRVVDCIGAHDARAMHLLQPDGILGQVLAQRGAIRRHRVRVIVCAQA